jgi:hypothetical protein
MFTESIREEGERGDRRERNGHKLKKRREKRRQGESRGEIGERKGGRTEEIVESCGCTVKTPAILRAGPPRASGGGLRRRCPDSGGGLAGRQDSAAYRQRRCQCPPA